MTAYLVGKIHIHDQVEYARYEAGFMEILLRFEGALLSVDESAQTLEGEWSATRTVLLRFPTQEQALAWYHSDDYQALATYRRGASQADIVLLQGLPPLSG